MQSDQNPSIDVRIPVKAVENWNVRIPANPPYREEKIVHKDSQFDNSKDDKPSKTPDYSSPGGRYSDRPKQSGNAPLSRNEPLLLFLFLISICFFDTVFWT